MKKNILLPLAAGLLLTGLLASCGEQSSSSTSSSTTSSSTTSSSSEESSSSYEPTIFDTVEYGASYYSGGATDNYDRLVGTDGGSNGITSFVGESVESRTDILGALEKYAVDNAVTGLPLYENGGYVMYDDRIVKGTETYVTGYGFGILREGYFTKDSQTTLNKKKSYYQTSDVSDPASINYLNSDGSQIGDLYSYIAGGYYQTKLNDTGDGYVWIPMFASKNRPYAVTIAKDGTRTAKVATATDTTDTWRIYLRDDLQYRTKSTINAEFDKKDIALEDYVNAYRILLCGKNGYYRGNELANTSGYGYIKGGKEYFNATKNLEWDDPKALEAFNKNVGILAGTDDDNGDYIDITVGTPCNRFYAMYALSSNLYAPINAEFFNKVITKADGTRDANLYGSFNSDKTVSPVDSILCTGPFMLESWESDKLICFARNDDWYECDELTYRIPGVAVNILAAGATDPNFNFKTFLAGDLDAAGIPTDYLDRWKHDPRTTTTTGDSVFKLNINSCTQEQWNSLFGTNGTVDQGIDNDYKCKPWMSNKDFLRGLFYSIDRNTFAEKRGSISSINYFSSNYMSDPEGGTAYNTTTQHAAALTNFWGSTVETGGFSKTLSSNAFDNAITALLADGKVKAGDKLSINIWWMYESQIKSMGEEIGAYISNAFNTAPKAVENNLTLEVENLAVTEWSDVYYKHLMVGQFDLGFGSVSGNSLDPLNFMEVLKSNNSSGFTLNWGPDTSKLNLEYPQGSGKLFSFDTLWAAADHGVLTYRGQEIPMFTMEEVDVKINPETFELTGEFAFNDATSHMVALAAQGDVDAREVVTSMMDEASGFMTENIEFVVSDDVHTLEFAGPFLATYGELIYGEPFEIGELIGFDDDLLEIISEGTTFAEVNDNWDHITFHIPQEIVTIFGEEAGYVDFYYYGGQAIGGNEAAGYVIHEYLLDVAA